jgi:hypothetical protein
MLAESDIAIYKGGFHRGKLRGAQILFAQKPVYGPGTDRTQEHAPRIDPTALDLLRSAADEHRARSAQSD